MKKPSWFVPILEPEVSICGGQGGAAEDIHRYNDCVTPKRQLAIAVNQNSHSFNYA